MNARRFRLALAVVGCLLAGCGHRESDGHAHTETTERDGEPGVSFNPRSGLLVPANTAKFIGLQIVDVQERKVLGQFRFTARVYQCAADPLTASAHRTNHTARASAMLGRQEADTFRAGQSAQVATDGAETLPGRIVAVNRELEQASGTIEVQLDIEDAGRMLPRGSYVTVTVPRGKQQNVVAVPRSALLQTVEGSFVYTVSGERFVRAAVKIGVLNDEFAEITDGLYAGDQVVTQPVMMLWLAELQSIRGGKACADGH
jgi:hypothetical protein